MKEFSELGGFRIAALDLELRGAGTCSAPAAWPIEAIGFDMYCQMLERAVSKLKGEETAPELRTRSASASTFESRRTTSPAKTCACERTAHLVDRHRRTSRTFEKNWPTALALPPVR